MIGAIQRRRQTARFFLAFYATPALLLACSAPEPGSIRSVSQQEITENLESGQGPLLLDVRTKREFVSGHLPGAQHVPVGELSERVDEIREASQDREVVVYCERGGRALKAGRVLLEAGFPKIGHLQGDMAAWRSQDLPIER